MRDYAKVAPTFWVGETGKKIRDMGTEAQVLAFYLITSPHANLLGLYYIPLPFISHETGLSMEGASKALQSLSEGGFCDYDPVSEHVWVYEMARFQIAESLKENDNRVKHINDVYHSLPKNPFLKAFFKKYGSAFHLENARGSKAPSKPLRSQEQEQEQLQEQEKETRFLFDKWYAAYPNKKDKGHAKKTWDKINPDRDLTAKMIRAVRAQQRWRAAMKQAGEFVPPWKNPGTWLNGECWDDALDWPEKKPAEDIWAGTK